MPFSLEWDEEMGRHKGSGARWNFIFEDTDIVRFRLGRAGSSAFDPYRHALGEMPPPAKKDLRNLGEWIKVKKAVEELKRQQAAQALKRREQD